MQKIVSALFLAPATTIAALSENQLISAGSLTQCTVSENKLSHNLTATGEPVLSPVCHMELYGRAGLSHGS